MSNKTFKISLIKRQTVWMLTLQGWVVAISLAASLTIFTVSYIYPFLAVSEPIQADVLVVEGWLPDYALKYALTEFENGSYRKIITTGGTLERGNYLAKYHNFAELAAATFQALGLKAEQVVAVPSPKVNKNRTYASAVALSQWLTVANLPIKSINLYTSDVHARRSWLTFKKILAPKIKVGVIAAKKLDYDADNWWSYSAGVREVVFQTIAYIYARFISLSA